MSPTITSPALMTSVGVLLGTAAYMSPEQAKGRPADKRSDVWSFGCVLFEMLAGERAFSGDDISDTLALVLKGEPDWSAIPQDVPSSIRALIRGCLKKDRRERIGDFSSALFLLNEPAGPTSTAGNLRTPKRHLVPALIATTIVFTVLGAWGGWTMRRPAPGVVAKFAMTLPDGEEFPDGKVVAISPDGSRIAYVSQGPPADGSTAPAVHLFVRSMDQVDGRPIFSTTLTTATIVGLSSPFFSDDGQWIGFWTEADSTLKKISVAGGTPLPIAKTNRPNGPIWEDNRILFGDTSKGIMRVSADGGEPEMLVAVSPTQQITSPQLLNGGRSLLFTLATDISDPARWDKGQIIIESLESKTRKVVMRGGSDARYFPTGHLVYRVGSTLLAVPFDEKSGAITGRPTPVIEGLRGGTGAGLAHFSVSPAGTLVYVPGKAPTFGTNETTVALVDVDGTEHPLSLRPQRYANPRFSPDGKQLAIEINDGSEAGIWIVDDMRSGRVRRLTLDGVNRYPVWSPDGRYLVFQSVQPGSAGLFRQVADGSKPAEQLTTADQGTAHVPTSFTSDGRTLAYHISVGSASDSSIWTLSLEGDRTPRRVAERNPAFSASFSPDGRWLAYAMIPGTGRPPNIFLQPFPSTGARYQVTTGIGANPVWSRDGRQIYYETGPRDPSIVAIDVGIAQGVRFGAAKRFAMRDPRVQGAVSRFYDVSPDGKQFVVVLSGPDGADPRVQKATQMIVVQNWFTELKRLAGK